uniref:Protein patched homolog 1-like n=1 Tax=Saccoglossus kowalevskii TaxID=10224 RepID=A0ABM0GXE9_SACKO|nr:PREDICTED: protein patched homolog 1-like [Saccoglossus kowalevskii]
MGERIFLHGIRVSQFIIEADNVLTPSVLQSMLTIDQSARTVNASGQDWESVCYRISGSCWSNSLLELWAFNETTILGLTQEDILDRINQDNISSPVTFAPIDVEKWLGDVTEDDGRIIAAKATIMTYFLEDNREYDPVSKREIDLAAQAWESEFILLRLENYPDVDNVYGFTQTSLREETGNTISSDVPLLSAGYMLILLYAIVMIGRFTMVEHKIYVGLGGIICAGLAILVSIGLSSAMGFFYGPVHTILPFLLLGIGVDDMFVVVQALNNLSPEVKQHGSTSEKIGQTLKHAGVSVTVTSITDFLAFGIGATTILPALRSFCFFCAIGILFLFLFSITIFAAMLAIDLNRINANRDACCCCFTHSSSYQPWTCGTKDRLQYFFRNIYGSFIIKLPVKICVIVVALGLLAVNIWGTINLKQQFKFEWFLPEDSFIVSYINTADKYFPSSGVLANVYAVNVNYYTEFEAMDNIYSELKDDPYVLDSSVDSWYNDFRNWMVITKAGDVYLGVNDMPTNETVYHAWVSEFLSTTAEGMRHVDDIKFAGGEVSFSRINFQFRTLENSAEEIEAMDSVRSIVKNAGFIENDASFVYSELFLGWDANKVIRAELYRNLGLALLAVFLVTLILIANLWTSILVFLCVALTLVDVTGMMYVWGLTIDTVTTINLILAVGLAVDYAAHIGHSFMTITGSRNDRTRQTLGDIGPAVFNGGFSTFLAFVLLIASSSYIFKVFFKIFFLVVLFGLFHGLVFLPVMLSWTGPSPYLSAEISSTDEDSDDVKLHPRENAISRAMEGHTSPIHIPRANVAVVVSETQNETATTNNGIFIGSRQANYTSPNIQATEDDTYKSPSSSPSRTYSSHVSPTTIPSVDA